jgi:hypothetical protein
MKKIGVVVGRSGTSAPWTYGSSARRLVARALAMVQLTRRLWCRAGGEDEGGGSGARSKGMGPAHLYRAVAGASPRHVSPAHPRARRLQQRRGGARSKGTGPAHLHHAVAGSLASSRVLAHPRASRLEWRRGGSSMRGGIDGVVEMRPTSSVFFISLWSSGPTQTTTPRLNVSARTKKCGNRNPAARPKQTGRSELVRAHPLWPQIWTRNALAWTARVSSPASLLSAPGPAGRGRTHHFPLPLDRRVTPAQN